MTAIDKLQHFANDIRIQLLKSLLNLGFGHFGGSLSIVETLAVLYGGIMKIDPQQPDWAERDYFVLSKGHGGPALYATLALKGYFPLAELMTVNQNGTRLPSHPDRLLTKGVDATTGSLGQGISIAAGIALSHQLRGLPNRTFCILGDGELNEGQCWEAFQFIAHRKLNNLYTFIDYNKLQLDGALTSIIDPQNLEQKFVAFGFDVVTVKGDDITELYRTLSLRTALALQQPNSKPLLIILDSKKGQGVPYIENLANSHHMRLTAESKQAIELAIQQLEAKYVD
ncbi:transketolase [Pasteurellaceae bacterium USgator11]|nr:transketolase [Pasteurellaceae bacterium UScroc12]TNG97335.1 transketolase [Pasteurellaceae bacterium UScroc31]TNG98332.1 transketolase [Pasteurellaceae bacterium USgator41]TNH02227.1 transketolase [Pasteurellaceae bacterium USgator11]